MLLLAIIWNLSNIPREKFSTYNILNKISQITFENEYEEIENFGKELGNWQQVEFEDTGNGFVDFFQGIGEFFTNLGLWIKNLTMLIYAVIKLIISMIVNGLKILGFMLGYDL